VCLDETPEDSEGLPDRFQRAQWVRLPDGAGNEDFRRRIVGLMRDYRKRARD